MRFHFILCVSAKNVTLLVFNKEYTQVKLIYKKRALFFCTLWLFPVDKSFPYNNNYLIKAKNSEVIGIFGGPIFVCFLKKINILNMIITFEPQIISIFSQIITIDLKIKNNYP